MFLFTFQIYMNIIPDRILFFKRYNLSLYFFASFSFMFIIVFFFMSSVIVMIL